MNKNIIAIMSIAFSNIIGFAISYLIPINNLNINLEAYGSAICGLSGTVLGFLMASLTIALGINGSNINKFKKYGYFDALILFYLLLFFELVLTFFSGLTCFISPAVDHILYISISLTISCLVCVFLAVIQIINLSIKN